MKTMVIECERVPEAYWFDPSCPVRGTDKFYVETARSAAKQGYVVTVCHDADEMTHVEGVVFVPRHQFAEYRPHVDVWIRCNPRGPVERPKNAVYYMVWTNFALPPGGYSDFVQNCPQTDRFCVISQYAKSRFQADCGQIDLKVVPHGIDHDIYWTQPALPRQPRVCFTSSPDRGLDVVKRVWRDYNLDAHAELWVSSYGTTEKADRDVAKTLRTSDFWVHPGVGEELFCLAAVEAQACGATPIVVPNGALSETVRFGYRLTRESFAERFALIVANRLTMKDIHANWNPSWDQATSILLGPT